MFNGIVYNTGEVKLIEKAKKSILLGVKSNLKFRSSEIGSSICCNGVCLTLTKLKKNLIYFYISNETMKYSNFKNVKIGDLINLEKSLIFGKKISGHFIQGHVDTTSKVKKITIVDKSWKLLLNMSKKNLIKFLVKKASISINGVSLTITNISKNNYEINVIPHTLKLTNLKNLKVNDLVNVELDIFGKYMYKYNS